MDAKIFVTEASDLLGRNIIPLLKQEQLSFIAATRQSEPQPQDLRTLFLEFQDLKLIARALAGIESLVLLLPMNEDAKESAQNILAAARTAGVKYILRISTLQAHPHSLHLWQRISGEIDALVEKSGIPFTILKSNLLMQNFTEIYREDLHQGALFLPEGEGRVSFIDSRDVAEAVTAILHEPFLHRRKIYELTGERPLSNAEAMSLISNATARRVSYIPVTEEMAIHHMQRQGMSAWAIEACLGQHRLVHNGKMGFVSHSVEEIVGHAPRSFEAFSREMSGNWRSQNENLNLGL